jgi:hypothetical protein
LPEEGGQFLAGCVGLTQEMTSMIRTSRTVRRH